MADEMPAPVAPPAGEAEAPAPVEGEAPAATETAAAAEGADGEAAVEVPAEEGGVIEGKPRERSNFFAKCMGKCAGGKGREVAMAAEAADKADREDKAATKLQAFQRGRSTRQRMQDMQKAQDDAAAVLEKHGGADEAEPAVDVPGAVPES